MSGKRVIVIGAGVVGLACARGLARAGLEVIVVERHGRAGVETSSRNSGVIHAGIHHDPQAAKSRLCIRGRELLYEYAATRGVPHQKTGKLLVAAEDADLPALERIHVRATAAGVTATRWDAARLRAEEPALRGVAALHIAESGIVDAHALMGALMADARDAGAAIAFGRVVRGLQAVEGGWEVATREARGSVDAPALAGDEAVTADVVVNAAGHGADVVAHQAGVSVDDLGWSQHPWRGDYFALSGAAPRARHALVYPVPTHGGLGIHLTRDFGGVTLAGPDAHPGRSLDVDPLRAHAFAESLARFLPGVHADHLRPAYAGVRPKLRSDGGDADFVVAEHPARLFHLLGIESPGLTASLALAEEIVAMASASLG